MKTEIKEKRIKELLSKVFDKAVDYKISMDLYQHQTNRLRFIYIHLPRAKNQN